jgi:PAS domain S-box-containing protein
MPFSSQRGQPKSTISITKLMSLLGAFAACVFAIAIPSMYYAISINGTLRTLTIEADFLAKSIERTIQARPDLWEFESARLNALISQPSIHGGDHEKEIRTATGKLVIKNDFIETCPIISASATFFDSGRLAGSIVLRHSIRSQIITTALLGILSSLLGYLLFFIFRTYPIRRLVNTLTDLQRAEEEQRLSRETAERLAGETAAIADVGRIISSTPDIDKVYERFAETVRKIVPFDRIVINNIDVEMNTVINIYMAGHEVSDRKIGVIYPLKGSGNFEMVLTKSSVLIQTEDFDEYKDRFPMLLSTFQAGFRSIMNIPLFSKGEIIGGLLLRSLKPYAYTDHDVWLAERVGNQIAGAIANAQMFTELKKMEETYRLCLENAMDVIYTIDNVFNVSSVSPSVERILGYKPQDLIGRPVSDLGNFLLMPESFEQVIADIGLVLKGETIPATIYRFIAKDGTIKFGEVSVSPAMRDGKISGIISVARDITERKEAEQKLRDAHAVQSLILENSTMGIALVRNRSFVWANGRLAELLGLVPEKIQGASTRVIYPSDESYETLGRLAYPALAGGGRSDNVMQLSRSDGSLFWCRFMGKALDLDAPQAGSIWMFEDINEREQAKEMLEKERILLRNLIDNVPDRIYAKDSEGRFIICNKAAALRMGMTSPTELIGKSDFDFVPPEMAQRFHADEQAIIQSGIPMLNREEPLATEGGTITRWNLATKVPLLDKQGNRIGIVGVGREITDRKQAEQKLRESEKKYRELYDFLPIPVYEMDLEANVTSVNRAIYETFGGSEEDFKKGFKAWQFLSPEAIDKSSKSIERLLKGEHIGGTEYTLKRFDGSVFPAIVVSSVIYENNNPVGLRGAIIDITGRKEAEQNLRDAHAKMAFLINSISSILITVSEDYRIVSWNTEAEKQFGIQEKEALGKPINALEIQWDLDQIMDGIARCRNGNNTVGLDNVRFRQRDGKEGVLGIGISPSFGEISFGMVTLMQGANVTRRRMMESQLYQAQKLESIGQLAAGIAHEINTPTQYVGDNVRFLQTSYEAIKKVLMKYDALTERIREGKACDDLLGEVEETTQEADLGYLTEEIPRAFQQTLEGVERVSRIVRSMKAFAHPGTAEKVPVDINKAIENTILVARNEWKYVADLVTDLDPSLPLVSCVTGDINQVILNVLVNAAQAVSAMVKGCAGGQGKISISTRQDDSWVEIRISDTGNGIPAEIRSRIFDPFFTTKEVGIGSGQGLAISHTAIVERHHGSITFDTEIGRGTTFKIRLPIQEPIDARNQDT